MAASNANSDDAISKIENVIEGIMRSLEKKEPLSIQLRYKTKPRSAESQTFNSPPPIRYRKICFPGKTPEEAKRFGRSIDSALRLATVCSCCC